MLKELSQSQYDVRLHVWVIDRLNNERLTEPVYYTTCEVPAFHYYTGDAAMLRAHLLHLARIRYVWFVKDQMNSDLGLRRALHCKDWTLQIEEADCTISPEPTEAHRLKMYELMSGGIHLPQQKQA